MRAKSRRKQPLSLSVSPRKGAGVGRGSGSGGECLGWRGGIVAYPPPDASGGGEAQRPGLARAEPKHSLAYQPAEQTTSYYLFIYLFASQDYLYTVSKVSERMPSHLVSSGMKYEQICY